MERVWGDDLRVEGVVVEPLDGVDALPEAVRAFGPGPGRRLGVLVDHLVAGTKESRIVAAVTSPDVLVTGHPYVDVWQAVRPQPVNHESGSIATAARTGFHHLAMGLPVRGGAQSGDRRLGHPA